MHSPTPYPGQQPGWQTPPAPPRRSNTAMVLAVIGVGALLLLGAAGVAAYLLLPWHDDASQYGGPEGVAHVEGVEYFGDLPVGHTEDPVDYPQSPPVGGEHHPQWLDCGVYDEPVPDEHAVHSLEHGAVWIAYRPDLPSPDVQQLTQLYEAGSYLIVAPYPGLEETAVASAWGSRLVVDSTGDSRIAEFLEVHEQGASVPEPGAPCSGGVVP